MKPLKYILVLGALALLITRLVIFVAWQYPAPVADSPLFLSVSHYHCTDGIYRTPIFPMDSELARYTWHGILQPALISLLSPNCSMQGHYVALTLLILATLILTVHMARSLGLKWLIIPFAVTIFALQAKQGFRPEVTSIFLALLTEHLITKKSKFFLAPLAAMAWTQPIGFVVYAIYIALFQDKAFYQRLVKDFGTHVLVAVSVNVAFLLTYPFPMHDHLQGMLLQGAKASVNSSEDWPKRLINYAVVSHFFPAFGVSLLACIAYLMRQRMRLALIFPVIYYFWFRKPEMVYNAMPLFVAAFYQVAHMSFMATESAKSAAQGAEQKATSRFTLAGGGLVICISLLAMLGLAQGVARDIASIKNFGASIESSQAIYTKWKSEGRVVCAVPMFFTQFIPFDEFEKSYGSVLKECVQAIHGGSTAQLYDTWSNSGHAHTEPNCVSSHEKLGNSLLGKVFKSDSGYSFSTCTTTPAEAGRYLEESKILK
jgi:hypothetical protein